MSKSGDRAGMIYSCYTPFSPPPTHISLEGGGAYRPSFCALRLREFGFVMSGEQPEISVSAYCAAEDITGG